MDSTVDCTFVTEGFSGAICKSKYSPKTLSDLLIINCVNHVVLCARFQESLSGSDCIKVSGNGAMRF